MLSTARRTSTASGWRRLAFVAAAGALAYHRIAIDPATDPLGATLVATGAPLATGARVLAAWAPALLLVLGYAVVVLGRAHERAAVHDRLARHVVAASVLAGLQLAWIDSTDAGLAAVLWTLIAVVAADAYVTIDRAARARQVRRHLVVPFAALLGVATLIAALALDAALAGLTDGSEALACVLVVALGVIAIACAVERREPLLPAVIGGGLAVMSAGATDDLAILGLGLGALALAIAVIVGATALVRPPAPAPRRPPVTRATPFADAIARQRFAPARAPSRADLRPV